MEVAEQERLAVPRGHFLPRAGWRILVFLSSPSSSATIYHHVLARCAGLCYGRIRGKKADDDIAYVDTNLVGTGKIAQAAILGQAGGVWAASAGFDVRVIFFYRYYYFCFTLLPLRLLTFIVLQISTDEQSVLIKALDNKDATQASGVRAAGNKYFTLQLTDRSVYGKKGVRAFPLSSFILTDAYYRQMESL